MCFQFVLQKPDQVSSIVLLRYFDDLQTAHRSCFVVLKNPVCMRYVFQCMSWLLRVDIVYVD